jgi:hypothetical protein
MSVFQLSQQLNRKSEFCLVGGDITLYTTHRSRLSLPV